MAPSHDYVHILADSAHRRNVTLGRLRQNFKRGLSTSVSDVWLIPCNQGGFTPVQGVVRVSRSANGLHRTRLHLVPTSMMRFKSRGCLAVSGASLLNLER